MQADTLLQEQLECLLAPETAKTIFILRFILFDILIAWEKRKGHE
jgi:hypothetical protein